MFSLFKKFREGLAKTVSAISSKTHGLFGGRSIDASSLEALEEALYSADFGVATTAEILGEIKAAARRDKALEGRQAAAIGAEVLRRALAGSEGTISKAATAPTVIVLIGVNGSGKTTTAAKLAWRLKQEGGSRPACGLRHVSGGGYRATSVLGVPAGPRARIQQGGRGPRRRGL